MASTGRIMAEVNALVQEAKHAGAWVFNGGLHPPSTATVVTIKGGDTLITDGPYAEGKAHVGGCLIVTAPDLDRALEWGRQLARVLGDGENSLPVEVRPFQSDAEG